MLSNDGGRVQIVLDTKQGGGEQRSQQRGNERQKDRLALTDISHHV